MIVCSIVNECIVHPHLNGYFDSGLAHILWYIPICIILYILMMHERFKFSSFRAKKKKRHFLIIIVLSSITQITAQNAINKMLINPIDIKSFKEIMTIKNEENFYRIKDYKFNTKEIYTETKIVQPILVKGGEKTRIKAWALCDLEIKAKDNNADNAIKVIAALKLDKEITGEHPAKYFVDEEKKLEKECRTNLFEDLNSSDIKLFKSINKWDKEEYAEIITTKENGNLPEHIILNYNFKSQKEQVYESIEIMLTFVVIHLIIIFFFIFLPKVLPSYIPNYEAYAQKKWYQNLW